MACAPDTTMYKDSVIETLQFPDVEMRTPPFLNAGDWTVSPIKASLEGSTMCILCQREYKLLSTMDAFHQHLLEDHQLIIHDPHLICDLQR